MAQFENLVSIYYQEFSKDYVQKILKSLIHRYTENNENRIE